ncbi:MAG: DUF402 domain-containing protein [bacterium]|nr:DUF402 domain-containing protein [bacterium]
MNRIYTVNSRKIDRTIRRSWKCDHISTDNDKVDLIGSFEQSVEHSALGIIASGTISRERFYFKRWYNFFIFQHPTGNLRNYYVNICMPPVVSDATIDYIDLDIDLIVWPDGQWQTLDLEEFEANRVEFGYPESVAARALATLAELERLMVRVSLEGIDTLHSCL